MIDYFDINIIILQEKLTAQCTYVVSKRFDFSRGYFLFWYANVTD